jgi:hypothetical protein
MANLTPEQTARLTDAYEAYKAKAESPHYEGRGNFSRQQAMPLAEWANTPEALAILGGNQSGPGVNPATVTGNKAQQEAASRAATMPTAGVAGGAIGLEKAPQGYTPWLTTTEGGVAQGKATYYQQGSEYTEWQDKGEQERIQWKQALWYAGFYGKSRPVLNGDVSPEDIQALNGAMGMANLNGKSWQDAIAPRVTLGEKQGGAYDPAASGQQAASGTFDQAVTKLREFAKNNGINLTEDFVGKNAKAIAEGGVSWDELTGNLRDKYVAPSYPGFADSIRAGQDVKDLAAPYVATMAKVLEIPEGSIDLQDKTVARALQAVDDKGAPATVPMWQFEQELKKDSRWQNTQNAWDEVGQQAYKIMGMFGLQG